MSHLRFFSLILLVNPCHAEQRIYSNVRYIEEGAGDLVGTELELTLVNDKVEGKLRIYQGACAASIPVNGITNHGHLRLVGSDSTYGKIEVSGTADEQSFQGILTLEKGIANKKLRLHRTSKPHC